MSPTVPAKPIVSPAPSLRPTTYDRGLLADGAVAIWPLSSATTVGTPGLGARGAGLAKLLGDVPAVTAGPVLDRAPRTALAFRGRSRFVTAVRTGLSAADAWTVELWVRADGCSRGFERLAATSSHDSRGRQGLDLLHYPSTSSVGCRYGAELYRDGSFLGGCATNHQPPVGRWQHLAFTYSDRNVRCYVNGEVVGRGTLRSRTPAPSTMLGIGGAGNGFDDGSATVSMAELAVYPRALTRGTLLRHSRAAH